MDNKIADFVLAMGMSVLIVMLLISIEELIGVKFLSLIGMGLIVAACYKWIRSWDK